MDGKSQSSQDSQDQDSNMEAEHVPEENGGIEEDVAATNGIPRAEDSENSNSSSGKNEEDSRWESTLFGQFCVLTEGFF